MLRACLSAVLCCVVQYSKLSQRVETHKGSKNPMLNFYYVEIMSFWPRLPWLLVFCVGNEMFLVCLYMLSFTTGGSDGKAGSDFHYLYTLLAIVSFPIFFMKQFFNVIQLGDAAGEVADADYAEYQRLNKPQ